MRFFSKKANQIKFGIAVVALTFAVVNYAQLNNNPKRNLTFKVLDAKADPFTCKSAITNFSCYYYEGGTLKVMANAEH